MKQRCGKSKSGNKQAEIKETQCKIEFKFPNELNYNKPYEFTTFYLKIIMSLVFSDSVPITF